MQQIIISPRQLSWNILEKVWQGNCHITLEESAYQAIKKSNQLVEKIIQKGEAAYGINTGFGLLAKERISDADLCQLQKNLILSHSAGVGKPMSAEVVRLIIVMKAASLSQGVSGVRPIVIDKLIELFNSGLIPVIPEKGSVGASGDLAPLSHLSLVLMGEGEVFKGSQIIPTKDAFESKNITPIELAAKEGLALINGTQVSTALTISGLFNAQQLLESACAIGAMTTDAIKGSDSAFDSRIHEVRGHQGQIDLAKTYQKFLESSEIRASHKKNDDRVQDPYCIRCQPQVMGGCLDLINQVRKTLLIEANAVTDNPLIFEDPEGPIALSGGNFHAEPVAFAADIIALAISEIGALSERRMALLIDSTLSGLPAFLIDNAGLNSGFMIAHVTAAALASENKSLAHPASVDSLPTSANQEDHVSMATFAGRRLFDMANNTRSILAIEYLAAAQGIDFRKPLQTSDLLQQLHYLIRDQVSFYDKDRLFSKDINQSYQLINSHQINDLFKEIFKKWYQ